MIIDAMCDYRLPTKRSELLSSIIYVYIESTLLKLDFENTDFIYGFLEIILQDYKSLSSETTYQALNARHFKITKFQHFVHFQLHLRQMYIFCVCICVYRDAHVFTRMHLVSIADTCEWL